MISRLHYGSSDVAKDPPLIESVAMLCTESVVADPPRFEHGLQAPQAHVISRLHYGSSAFSTGGLCLTPTVSGGNHMLRGSTVFHLGSASFLALGAILVFLVL